jgi:hypothetical protein
MCSGSRRGFDWRRFRTEVVETMAGLGFLLVGLTADALLSRDDEAGLKDFRRCVAANRRHWRRR